MLPQAYFRKKIGPMQDANISIASNSLHYGTMCFGGLRGYWDNGVMRVFRIDDHFDRLLNATKILGIPFTMSQDEFKRIIVDLIKKNNHKGHIYIRPIIFSETQMLGPHFDGLHFDLAVFLCEFEHYFDMHKGMKLMISTWRKFSDDTLPTKAKAGGTYINSALAQTEATRCGYDDALMLDQNGFLVESSGSNVFIVYRGEVIMPQTGSAMLEGITRRTVIEILKEDGYPVKFEQIDRSMAYSADEVILTGTAAQVLFVESIDGRIIGKEGKSGPIFKHISEQFNKVVQGTHPKASSWITEIKL
jgi:branched-chain amino acid aminotransferase